jgi:flagellin
MSAAVSLTNGMRTALNGLDSLDSMIATSNKRLATGKKVNDVLDNPAVYYQAQTFRQNATDYDNLLNNMNIGGKTIEKAVTSLDTAKKVLETAKGLATQALSLTVGSAARDAIMTQIRGLVDPAAAQNQFNQAINDGTFSGKNLNKFPATAGANDLSIKLDPTNSASVLNVAAPTSATLEFKTIAAPSATSPVPITAAGVAAGATDAQLNTLITELSTGADNVQARSNVLAASLSTLQVRVDFNKKAQDISNSTADALTLANMNEEGAKLSTLQTRQQLAVNALSLANRSDQAILRLF